MGRQIEVEAHSPAQIRSLDVEFFRFDRVRDGTRAADVTDPGYDPRPPMPDPAPPIPPGPEVPDPLPPPPDPAPVQRRRRGGDQLIAR
jgi:hypothetical protein